MKEGVLPSAVRDVTATVFVRHTLVEVLSSASLSVVGEVAASMLGSVAADSGIGKRWLFSTGTGICMMVIATGDRPTIWFQEEAEGEKIMARLQILHSRVVTLKSQNQSGEAIRHPELLLPTSANKM